MTHLAVFDWNSTLLDDTSAMLYATNACLESFGRPVVTLAEMQDVFSFPLIHFYERMGVPVDEYLARAEEEGTVFLKAYEDMVQDCGLAEGAVELLDWLQSKDVHCMILSNHLQPLLDGDVERLGIAPYMKHVSGNAEKATITKGLSKQIRLEAYMQEHGFTPDKAFIIGDSHEEPELARHMGLLGVAIVGGVLSAERLAKCRPDHLIHKLAELRPILENHWKL